MLAWFPARARSIRSLLHSPHYSESGYILCVDTIPSELSVTSLRENASASRGTDAHRVFGTGRELFWIFQSQVPLAPNCINPLEHLC